MIDLGTLGGNASSGDAINDMGQVAGFSYTSEGEQRVFITGPNGKAMAEAPFGKESLGGGISINNRGMAINDMNNVGQVVGWYFYHGNFGIGFMSGPGGVGVTEVGGNNAEAVNNIGQVTGVRDLYSFYHHAFITGPDGAGNRDLGTLNPNPDEPFGFYSRGLGINDAGQVVGRSTTLGGEHAFITGPDGAGMIDLGTLGGSTSFGAGINDAGQVVGGSNLAGGDFDAFHAFVTGPNGEGMMDLNSLVDLPADGLILTSAYAINNAGQIIAAGIIPEPEIYALLLTGLVLVGFAGSRRTMG